MSYFNFLISALFVSIWAILPVHAQPRPSQESVSTLNSAELSEYRRNCGSSNSRESFAAELEQTSDEVTSLSAAIHDDNQGLATGAPRGVNTSGEYNNIVGIQSELRERIRINQGRRAMMNRRIAVLRRCLVLAERAGTPTAGDYEGNEERLTLANNPLPLLTPIKSLHFPSSGTEVFFRDGNIISYSQAMEPRANYCSIVAPSAGVDLTTAYQQMNCAVESQYGDRTHNHVQFVCRSLFPNALEFRGYCRNNSTILPSVADLRRAFVGNTEHPSPDRYFDVSSIREALAFRTAHPELATSRPTPQVAQQSGPQPLPPRNYAACPQGFDAENRWLIQTNPSYTSQRPEAALNLIIGSVDAPLFTPIPVLSLRGSLFIPANTSEIFFRNGRIVTPAAALEAPGEGYCSVLVQSSTEARVLVPANYGNLRCSVISEDGTRVSRSDRYHGPWSYYAVRFECHDESGAGLAIGGFCRNNMAVGTTDNSDDPGQAHQPTIAEFRRAFVGDATLAESQRYFDLAPARCATPDVREARQGFPIAELNSARSK